MLEEIKQRVENKTYTPADVWWLIHKIETEQVGITFIDYQLQSSRTLPEDIDAVAILTAAVGLCGEAGECADLVKKVVSHGHEVDKQRLASEIGDVLWYVAAIATYYEIDLGAAALQNIWKLRHRYPHGFNHEASRSRKDVT